MEEEHQQQNIQMITQQNEDVSPDNPILKKRRNTPILRNRTTGEDKKNTKLSKLLTITFK